MTRRLRAALVGVVCVAGLTVAGCGAGGEAASASLHSGPVTTWLEEAGRIAEEGVPEGRVIAESKPVLDAPAGVRPVDLDRLVHTAPPPTADPQVTELIRALRARQAATALAADALRADQLGGAAIDATVAASTTVPEVRSELQNIGRDVFRDVACDAFLDQLQPSERQEAESSGQPAWEQIGSPTVEAIENATAARLSPGFGQFVEWSNWGAGIAGDAQDIADAAQTTATTPDAVHSAAFYYYVRICLVPPS